jgi:thymidylate synthase ThyX
MIKVDIVADSVGPNGVRLTTFVLTYPRFIHAEFMTHRVFSRNASSSRAIPVKRSIQMVIDNPVIPLAFTKNQKGMQGGEALSGEAHDKAVKAWLKARDYMVECANELADLEVHKQYANRILEAFSTITVVMTATDLDNFFALRCHEAAQPEIHLLADMMYEKYKANSPRPLKTGYWHLPFVDDVAIQEVKDRFGVSCLQDSEEALNIAIKRSVARCARVSYLNHDGTATTIEQDLQLYDRLLGQVPIHASPAEHQAMAQYGDIPKSLSGNLRGWIQYRKTLDNENVTKFEGLK